MARPKKHPVGSARTALLRAACTLFAQRGFEGASTHEIARRAQVPQGLVRHHFGSKEALWMDVVRSGLNDLNARFERDAATPGLRVDRAASWTGALLEQGELVQLVLHALLEPGLRRSWLLSELSASATGRALVEWARGSVQAEQLTDRDVVLICVRILGACGVPALLPVLETMRGHAIDAAAFEHVLRRTFDDAPRVPERRSVAGPWSLAAATQRRARAANPL